MALSRAPVEAETGPTHRRGKESKHMDPFVDLPPVSTIVLVIKIKFPPNGIEYGRKRSVETLVDRSLVCGLSNF